MKQRILQLKESPRLAKILRWSKLISITGSSQALVQVIGLLCGFIIIRLLPTKEFAIYTLANSILGTLTLLSDGGISTGVLSEGAKVWSDKKSLGKVLFTGFQLRKKFALVSLLIAIPVLAYLLVHHEASWITTILVILTIIPNFFAGLSDSLLENVFKLNDKILFIQKNSLIVSFLRLILTVTSLFFLPFAFIAFIGNGIPRIYGNYFLRKESKRFVEKADSSDIQAKKRIIKLVKNTLPTSIYYSLSGQLTVWLISIFGKTSSVAEIGALGRITMMLTVFSSVLGTLTVPKYAKLTEQKGLLRKYFYLLICIVTILSAVVTGITSLLSTQLLGLLGAQYTSLSYELMLSMIAACVSLLSGTTFTLYSCRGWMINPIFPISADIVAIIVGLYIFDISSLQGVLYFNILVSTVLFLANFVFMNYKISKINSYIV